MPFNRFIWIFGGTAASQLILFLTNPIIAYLYGTNIYGQLSWALTFSAILMPLMTGRMEVYLMGARDPASIYPSIVVSAILTSFCAASVVAIDVVFRINRIPAPTYITVALAATLATNATTSSLFCINNKIKHQAIQKLIRTISIFGIATAGYAYWEESINGLLIAYSLGTAFAILITLYLAKPLISSTWRQHHSNWQHETKPFFLFNTPHAFICALTSGLPLAYIYERFGPATAGQYSFAWQYLVGPTQLIAGSLYQTMYQSSNQITSTSKYITKYAPPLIIATSLIVALFHITIDPSQIHIDFLGEWGSLAAFYIYLLPIPIIMLSSGSLAFLPITQNRQKTNFIFESVFISGYLAFLLLAPQSMTSDEFIKTSAWIFYMLRLPQLFWYFKLLKRQP